MVVRYTKAIRPVFQSISRQTCITTSRRTLFTPSAVRSADLVQQMYLKELSSYKPTPLKSNDADAHVQKFTVPKAPASPEEANIANELKTYETQQPEIEGNSSATASAGGNVAAAVEEDWFEEEPEEQSAAH